MMIIAVVVIMIVMVIMIMIVIVRSDDGSDSGVINYSYVIDPVRLAKGL